MKTDFNRTSSQRAHKMTNASASFSRFLFINFVENNLKNIVLFVCCLSILLADATPHRSRNKDAPQLVYDQKQTGDYNIQLHLKDFQIIALLGDDSLGDYDYNYDYADFTIKPSGPSSTSTTAKPSTTTSIPSTTTSSNSTDKSPTSTKPSEILIPENPSTNSHSNPSSSRLVSNVHPYPLEIVVLDPPQKPAETEKIIIKASKGSNEDLGFTNKNNKTTENSLNEIINTTAPNNLQSSTSTSSTSPTPSTSVSSPSETITLDKIKVQILEAPTPTDILAAIPVGIVPGEDVQADGNDGILQGELASYRKCASGFSRDKRGRCRRVRRPGVASQLPFNFGRIAGNLATRLRLPNYDKAAVAPNSAQN